MEHGELLATLLSGLLIFGSWLLSKAEINTASTILYILVFCIGGFAKAKEGLEVYTSRFWWNKALSYLLKSYSLCFSC